MRKTLILVLCLLVTASFGLILEQTLVYLIEYNEFTDSINAAFLGIEETVVNILQGITSGGFFGIGVVRSRYLSDYVYLMYAGPISYFEATKLVVNKKSFELVYFDTQIGNYAGHPYCISWKIANAKSFFDEILLSKTERVIVEVHNSYGKLKQLTINKELFKKFIDSYQNWIYVLYGRSM